MNKNIVLIGFGAIALVLVSALFLFSPQKEHISLTQPLSSQTSKNRENIDITYQKEDRKNSDNKSSKHLKSKPKPKKIDPSIKAATIDHYNTYLIQLIDKNPEDKDLKLENKPDSYVYVEGRVNGKEYVLRVPKSVVTRPGIKIKITNLKTKKNIELDASFLSESASLPIGSTYRVNIDTRNPNNIQTDIELSKRNPAFPTFRE